MKVELRVPYGCEYKLTEDHLGLTLETDNLDHATHLVEVLYSSAMALERQVAQERRDRVVLPKWSV
jgi:hypothetical protein